MPDHRDTVAVITGGSRGPGCAIAERLSAEGCGPLAISGRAVTRGEAAAEALRGHRIGVHAISCSWIDPPGEDATPRQYHGAADGRPEAAVARQPFGMPVKPARVAGLASHLVGPASGAMTGAVFDFDQNVAGAHPE